MRRELIATVSDVDVSISVEPEDGGLFRVCVGESSHVIDARPVRPGTWSLLVEGRSYLVDLDRRKGGLAVLCGTSEVSAALEDARRRRLAQTVAVTDSGRSGEVVRAPIAGKVVKTLVVPGDAVEAGQSVAVLEAMKMENEIKADSGGTVRAVHVQAGQSVETSDKLVSLE